MLVAVYLCIKLSVVDMLLIKSIIIRRGSTITQSQGLRSITLTRRLRWIVDGVGGG